MADDIFDCAIVGGGPAGLTAATYLGRSRRRFVIFDTDESRARWIPTSHNTPGFPEGVHGADLLHRLRAQARAYGPPPRRERVTSLAREEDATFRLQLADGPDVRAKRVILATGIRDKAPELPHLARDVQRGLIRACPICDGYECAGKSLGVLGSGDHAAREALFLRTYSDRVTVVLTDDQGPSPENLRRLEQAGIGVVLSPVTAIRETESGLTCLVADGGGHPFEVVYSALGVEPHSELGARAGAELNASGRFIVDDHMHTTLEGLFAAGDVVRGLNQVAVAYAEAAIAAIAIHNGLPRNFA